MKDNLIGKELDQNDFDIIVEQDKCICQKNIKFKNGMNYFKDLTYNFQINNDRYSVSYEDGRFTTMSKDIFDEHFQVI